MSKWISVKERVPNNVEDVLITDGYDRYAVAYFSKDKTWEVSKDILICGIVTHWMPLPEPPEKN